MLFQAVFGRTIRGHWSDHRARAVTDEPYLAAVDETELLPAIVAALTMTN